MSAPEQTKGRARPAAVAGAPAPLTADGLQSLALYLSDIATQADSLAALMSLGDAVDPELGMAIARKLALQIGMQADLAAGALGAVPVRGTAENWLLSDGFAGALTAMRGAA